MKYLKVWRRSDSGVRGISGFAGQYLEQSMARGMGLERDINWQIHSVQTARYGQDTFQWN